MKRTPWFFLAANTAVLITLAALAWLARPEVGSDDVWLPLRGATAAVERNVWTWVFCTTLVGIAIQFAEKGLQIYGARKRTVQGILDQVVKNLLGDDPRNNRCTLFKAASGWRVFVHGILRLPWQEDVLLVLRDLVRLLRHPRGTYLYVYVRAKRSNNDRSCAFWRVYHNKPDGCEGVAGQVWLNDYFTQSQKQRIDPEVRTRQLASVSSLGALKANTTLRRYANETHISNIHQLRARQRAARHFVGSVIESRDASQRWGVLLVDSIHDESPFPTERNDDRFTADEAARFKSEFQTYARILSTILT